MRVPVVVLLLQLFSTRRSEQWDRADKGAGLLSLVLLRFPRVYARYRSNGVNSVSHSLATLEKVGKNDTPQTWRSSDPPSGKQLIFGTLVRINNTRQDEAAVLILFAANSEKQEVEGFPFAACLRCLSTQFQPCKNGGTGATMRRQKSEWSVELCASSAEVGLSCISALSANLPPTIARFGRALLSLMVADARRNTLRSLSVPLVTAEKG